MKFGNLNELYRKQMCVPMCTHKNIFAVPPHAVTATDKSNTPYAAMLAVSAGDDFQLIFVIR